MSKGKVPYRPSWQNRFTRWVHDLRFELWKVYSVIALLILIYSIVTRYLAGVFPAELSALVVYEALSDTVLISIILIFHQYLDREIGEAADKARTLVEKSDEEFSLVRYKFLNMHHWQYLLVFILGAVPGFSNGALLYGFKEISLKHIPLLLEWVVASGLFSGMLLFLGHLLVRTLQFYSGKLKLNIFNLWTVYELPSLGARLGIVILLIFYLNVPLNVNEEILASASTILVTIAFSLIPLLALLLPYAVINRRLQDEKKGALERVSLQIQEAFSELDKQFKSRRLAAMPNMNSTIMSLEAKKAYIEKIPTWPWRTGAFRITFSAVLLPVVVFIIQQLLARFLM